MVYCYSCGSILKDQLFSSSNKNYHNFINDNHCLRCFRIKHYKKLLTFNKKDCNYDSLFTKIKQQNGTIFYVISIIDFFGSLIHQYHKYLKDLPFYIIITKIDTIIHYTSFAKIKIWVSEQLKLVKLKPVAFFLVSSKENYFINELCNQLNQWKSDIYWIGKKSVGKTSLIIKLLLVQKSYSRKLPFSSYLLNTKIEVILIPYKDYLYFYDIASISNFNQINFNLNFNMYLKINFINKIKIKTYRLDSQQAITIVGLWQLLFEKGVSTTFNFYGSDKLILHRSRGENRFRIWDQQILLLKEETEMVEHVVRIIKNSEELIAIQIYGYGWFTFKARQQLLRLRLPKHCGYKIIRPLI